MCSLLIQESNCERLQAAVFQQLFLHFFGGLNPSWRSSSNNKVRSEFSLAKREVTPELGVIKLELELATVPVELITQRVFFEPLLEFLS